MKTGVIDENGLLVPNKKRSTSVIGNFSKRNVYENIE